MESHSVKSPVGWRMLVMLHILLGTSAVFGGIALIIDPSGASVGLQASLLETSPFRDFLIPGILLFFVLGILPLLTAYGLFALRPWKSAGTISFLKNMHWAWNWSLYMGVSVIVWITVQLLMIREIFVLHGIYIAVGLAIMAITLLPSVRNIFRTEEKEKVSMPVHPESS